jgi:hypothetical protein
MEFMNRLFHAAPRRDLERALGSLSASRHPSPAHRAALAEHVGLVLELLHHHHTGEDIGLWPLVRRRAPDLGSQLDMMEAEHASVAGAIVSTRAAARQYAATAEPSAAHDLRQALVELSGVLLPHLEHVARGCEVRRGREHARRRRPQRYEILSDQLRGGTLMEDAVLVVAVIGDSPT